MDGNFVLIARILIATSALIYLFQNQPPINQKTTPFLNLLLFGNKLCARFFHLYFHFFPFCCLREIFLHKFFKHSFVRSSVVGVFLYIFMLLCHPFFYLLYSSEHTLIEHNILQYFLLLRILCYFLLSLQMLKVEKQHRSNRKCAI